MAEVESYQEGSKRYYKFQVFVDTDSGATESTFNIRSTENQTQDDTEPEATTSLIDIPPAVTITVVPNEAFDATQGRTPLKSSQQKYW